MLAVASAAQSLNGREVIVAIVGGTMLTLALTRPRLRWMERLTEDSDSARAWAERALTVFSFVMAGYAAVTVGAALRKQLDPESAALLKGAAGLMALYAWLVHLEPFAREWRLRGGFGACMLYTGVATLGAAVGFVLAEVVLTSSVGGAAARLLLYATVIACLSWAVYRFGSGAKAYFDKLLGGPQASG